MFTALTFLFALLSVLSIIALIIGLIKPGKVLRFGNKKTRGRVILIFLSLFFVSFILTGVFSIKAMTPEERVAFDKKRAEEKLLKEKQAQEKVEKEKEKEAKEKEEQEKIAQAKQKEAKEKEEQKMKAEQEKKVAEEKRKQEEAQQKAEKEAKEKAEAEEKEKLKKEEEEKKQAEKLEKDKANKEKAFEDKVKKVVNKKFDKKNVESIQINDNAGTDDPNDKIVLVTAEGKENLTNNMTKKGMWMDTVDILKNLSNEKEISEIVFFYTFPMVDPYGNKKKDTVMKITLNRETLDKINFDNFLFDNLPKIADQYWEHPAFNKK
ncbi:Protein of unknown function [Bacillus cytotoxicus]|nr:Protein of unknown function [Bacillus cytotoxicus]